MEKRGSRGKWRSAKRRKTERKRTTGKEGKGKVRRVRGERAKSQVGQLTPNICFYYCQKVSILLSLLCVCLTGGREGEGK